MPESTPGGSEPIMTSGKRKRGPFDVITVIVGLVVVAVLVANVLKQREQAPPSEEVAPGEEQAETPEEETPGEVSKEPTESESDIVTDYMRGSTFEQKTRAESTINGSQGKTTASPDYEYIVTGVVTDETNSDLVYFATQSNHADGNFVGVYQYNTRTFQWQRFYKNSYLPEGELSPKELRVIGKDGRNLILLVDRMDREEGDCDSLWLIGTQDPYELVTINLDKPLDGLMPYELSATMRAQEEQRVAACEAA